MRRSWESTGSLINQLNLMGGGSARIFLVLSNKADGGGFSEVGTEKKWMLEEYSKFYLSLLNEGILGCRSDLQTM